MQKDKITLLGSESLKFCVSFFLFSLICMGCGTKKEEGSQNEKFSENSKQTEQKFLYRYVVDLNNDTHLDTILLSEAQSGDPGIFKKIEIRGKGLKSFVLSANDAWDSIPLNIKKENEIKSNLIFLKKFNNADYILLTGWHYGTGREDFALISIANENVNLLIKEGFHEVLGFKDLNNDGILEIIVNPSWSEGIAEIDSLNASVASYAPFYAYSITPTTFTLDTLLTRKFNEDHYIWEGLDSIQKVQVIHYKTQNKYKVFK